MSYRSHQMPKKQQGKIKGYQQQKQKQELLSSDILDELNRTNKLISQVIQTLTTALVKNAAQQPEKLLQMNKSLIHLLQVIDAAPEDKISTRELLRTIKSYNMHRFLKEAEELGFVSRRP